MFSSTGARPGWRGRSFSTSADRRRLVLWRRAWSICWPGRRWEYSRRGWSLLPPRRPCWPRRRRRSSNSSNSSSSSKMEVNSINLEEDDGERGNEFGGAVMSVAQYLYVEHVGDISIYEETEVIQIAKYAQEMAINKNIRIDNQYLVASGFLCIIREVVVACSKDVAYKYLNRKVDVRETNK
mmetsp:Transcript_28078/g.56922  ORF Transcript_28078/g.56922 Transcript_28078/m.56922 type:complete len:182 (-) Transcript_28078:2353-2898(-)